MALFRWQGRSRLEDLATSEIARAKPHEEIGKQFRILLRAVPEYAKNLVSCATNEHGMILEDFDATKIDKVASINTSATSLR